MIMGLRTTPAEVAALQADVTALKTKAKVFAESDTDTQLTIANGTGEITIKTFDKTTYGTGEIKAFKVDLDKATSGFQTLAAVASTIKLRVYEKIDGTNYRLRTDDGSEYTWTDGIAGDKVAEIDEISYSEDIQIRAVLSVAPTGTINLPWLCELNKNMGV
jgi:stress response protein SCP2